MYFKVNALYNGNPVPTPKVGDGTGVPDADVYFIPPQYDGSAVDVSTLTEAEMDGIDRVKDKTASGTLSKYNAFTTAGDAGTWTVVVDSFIDDGRGGGTAGNNVMDGAEPRIIGIETFEVAPQSNALIAVPNPTGRMQNLKKNQVFTVYEDTDRDGVKDASENIQVSDVTITLSGLTIDTASTTYPNMLSSAVTSSELSAIIPTAWANWDAANDYFGTIVLEGKTYYIAVDTAGPTPTLDIADNTNWNAGVIKKIDNAVPGPAVIASATLTDLNGDYGLTIDATGKFIRVYKPSVAGVHTWTDLKVTQSGTLSYTMVDGDGDRSGSGPSITVNPIKDVNVFAPIATPAAATKIQAADVSGVNTIDTTIDVEVYDSEGDEIMTGNPGTLTDDRVDLVEFSGPIRVYDAAGNEIITKKVEDSESASGVTVDNLDGLYILAEQAGTLTIDVTNKVGTVDKTDSTTIAIDGYKVTLNKTYMYADQDNSIMVTVTDANGVEVNNAKVFIGDADTGGANQFLADVGDTDVKSVDGGTTSIVDGQYHFTGTTAVHPSTTNALTVTVFKSDGITPEATLVDAITVLGDPVYNITVPTDLVLTAGMKNTFNLNVQEAGVGVSGIAPTTDDNWIFGGDYTENTDIEPSTWTTGYNVISELGNGNYTLKVTPTKAGTLNITIVHDLKTGVVSIPVQNPEVIITSQTLVTAGITDSIDDTPATDGALWLNVSVKDAMGGYVPTGCRVAPVVSLLDSDDDSKGDVIGFEIVKDDPAAPFTYVEAGAPTSHVGLETESTSLTAGLVTVGGLDFYVFDEDGDGFTDHARLADLTAATDIPATTGGNVTLKFDAYRAGEIYFAVGNGTWKTPATNYYVSDVRVKTTKVIAENPVMQVRDTSANPIEELTAGEEVTMVMYLEDALGSPVGGQEVGIIRGTQGWFSWSGETNDEGTVTIVFTPSSTGTNYIKTSTTQLGESPGVPRVYLNQLNVTVPLTQLSITDVTPASVVVDVPTDVSVTVMVGTTPISGATVTIGTFTSGTTDGTGVAIIPVTAGTTGTLAITATKAGYAADSAELTVSAAPLKDMTVTATPSTINASEATSIKINVTDASTGAAIDGASVALEFNGTEIANCTTTDGECTVTVNVTETGTINVTVTASGYNAGSDTVTVGAAGLPKTGDIDGSGAISMDDVIYLAKHYYGTELFPGYGTIYAEGDIDCDGDID
ncbi:MAG: hypothetical protein DRH04_07110, partial [Deltaproteobacteria bacterium]